MRRGPPDDDPPLILEVLCLNGGPPFTLTHWHISFLKTHLRLSTLQPAFIHISYNKNPIDQNTARFAGLCDNASLTK